MKKTNFFKAGIQCLVTFMLVVPLAWAAYGVVSPSSNISAATTYSSTMSLREQYHDANLTVLIVPTATSGAPSVTNTVEGLDVNGNAYTLCAGTAITSAVPTTIQVLHIGPSVSAVTATSTGASCNVPVPDKWRVKSVNANVASNVYVTQSITYNTAP